MGGATEVDWQTSAANYHGHLSARPTGFDRSTVTGVREVDVDDRDAATYCNFAPDLGISGINLGFKEFSKQSWNFMAAGISGSGT